MSDEHHATVAEPPLQVGVDDVHAHHHTGHRWLDLIIALSAITISVISLFVAIEHGRTEEKMVAATSWPFLVYQSESDGIGPGQRAIILKLENDGVGPARVQSVRMMLDGKPVPTLAALMTACCGVGPRRSPAEQVPLGLYTENALVGVLPARSSVTFLAWRQLADNAAIVERLDRARHRLSFSACYCSVLDECWTTDLKSTSTPRPVAACPIGGGYSE